MNCPKCKEAELRKLGFDSPYNCYKCGGMWIEHEKFPEFIERQEQTNNEEIGTGLNDDKTGLCPAGHGIMIRARIDIDEPFYLEKCSTCGGVWFDNGEWKKIINYNLTESFSEFWCAAWQIKQRNEKNRRNYLDINRKLLGDTIFNEIMNLSEILKSHPEKGRALALLQQEIL